MSPDAAPGRATEGKIIMTTMHRTPATAASPVLDVLGYEAWLGYGDTAGDAR